MQHGWLSPHQISQYSKRSAKTGGTMLLWTASQGETQNCIPIGAPWLYFLQTINFDGDRDRFSKRENPRVFVIPHRGLSNKSYNYLSISLIKKWLRNSKLQERDVKLFHWADYLDFRFTRELEEIPGENFCAGFSGFHMSMRAESNVGGRKAHLENLTTVLMSCKQIHFMEPSTVSLYAAYLGIPIKVSDELARPYLDLYINYMKENNPNYNEVKLRLTWDYMYEFLVKFSHQNRETNFQIASDLLGNKHLRTPAELSKILCSSPKVLQRIRFLFNGLNT